MLKLNSRKAIFKLLTTQKLFGTYDYLVDQNKPLMLFLDSSDTHVGAVHEQEGKNREMRPLAFFSKKLPPLRLLGQFL